MVRGMGTVMAKVMGTVRWWDLVQVKEMVQIQVHGVGHIFLACSSPKYSHIHVFVPIRCIRSNCMYSFITYLHDTS